MWCSANGFGSADHNSIGDDPAAVYFSWRSAFCRGYLEAMGRPAGEEDVFALLLDVERCSPCTAAGFSNALLENVAKLSK